MQVNCLQDQVRYLLQHITEQNPLPQDIFNSSNYKLLMFTNRDNNKQSNFTQKYFLTAFGFMAKVSIYIKTILFLKNLFFLFFPMLLEQHFYKCCSSIDNQFYFQFCLVFLLRSLRHGSLIQVIF